MAIERRNPAALPQPGGHYSHATVANGVVYIAGQLPITATGEKLVDAPFDDQARQVLANLEAVLFDCGCRVDDLLQVRVYLDSIENWPAFNAVYAQWAGESKPARAIVPTGPLHFGLKVEVEAVALQPHR